MYEIASMFIGLAISALGVMLWWQVTQNNRRGDEIIKHLTSVETNLGGRIAALEAHQQSAPTAADTTALRVAIAELTGETKVVHEKLSTVSAVLDRHERYLESRIIVPSDDAA